MQTETLTGSAAIEYAEANGLLLGKHADPIEGARWGLSPEEAREVAAQDPSLIYVVRPEDGEIVCRSADVQQPNGAQWNWEIRRNGSRVWAVSHDAVSGASVHYVGLLETAEDLRAFLDAESPWPLTWHN